MKRCNLFLLLFAGGLLTANTGCGQPSIAETQPNAATASTEKQTSGSRGTAVRVTADKPLRTTLRLETVQPGRIEAFEQTPLYSKIAGYVQEIPVDIGDRVEKGDLLVRLWVPEMEEEVRQKQALLGQAKAQVRQAEAAVKAADAAVTTARAQVAEAQAGLGRADGDFDRWQSEHNRMVDLAGRGSVSQKLVDEARNQFKSAEGARQEALAKIESARSLLGASQANHEKAQADEGAARARLEVAQADLQRADVLLNYAEIRAPYAGIVTQRRVHTGHFVQPAQDGGARPLVVVARDDMLRISIDVPEVEAPLVDPGDPVVVRVQALRGREITGTVARTGWALDPANRTLRVEIDLPNSDGTLRPGMYATASILLAERPDVLALPTTAILWKGRETFCCTVQDGCVVHQPVTLGLKTRSEVEILSGLTGSESVVQVRPDSLEEGQSVEVLTR